MLYASFSAASDDADIMRATVSYWLASQTAEGLFPYGFDFLADSPLEPDRMSPSNLARQAGTVSALAGYYRHARDERLQEPIRRALEALGRKSLPIGKSRAQSRLERTRLLSLPFARWKLQFVLERFDLLYERTGSGKVVSPDGDYSGAFAGTTALSLLAEVIYASASGQADLFLSHFQSALVPDHNQCPAMEGVAATLAVLNDAGEGDTERVRQLRSWLMQQRARLPQLQIQPGQAEIALGGESRLRARSMPRFVGAFLLGRYEPTTRVDLAAHCLWALLLTADNPELSSR